MAGTLSATVTQAIVPVARNADFTAIGALGVQSIKPVVAMSATLSSAGTLTAAAFRSVAVTATFSSSGTLSASSTFKMASSVTFTSTGTLSATVTEAPFTPFTEENTARTGQALPTHTGWVGAWVTLIGAGASGAGGNLQPSFTVSNGGGGGGGGALIPRTFFPKASLGSTFDVTVPAGTTGGGARSGSNGNGGTGVSGGAATFSSGSTSLSAGGGVYGGYANPVWGGGPGGTASGTTGVAGNAGGNHTGVGGSGPATNSGGGGGGGGGYVTSGNANVAGASGGTANGQAGGVYSNGNGSALTSGIAGSGGAGNATNVGFTVAGAGLGYGAGGGGGGAGRGGIAYGGNGGPGGPGYSKIEFVSAPPPLVSFADVGAGDTTTGGAGTSLSWSHTITGNVLVVAFNFNWNGGTFLSAKVGTTTVPLIVSYSPYFSTNLGTAICALLSPPTGTQTITVNWTGNTAFMAGNSMSYSNATGITAVANAGGAGASMSMPTTTAGYNQTVVQAFSGYTATMSAYNRTQRYYQPYTANENLSLIAGDAVGVANPTFTATQSAAGNWGGCAVNLLNT